ncbi:MAG: cytochrome C [Nitrospirae bacterium RBG_19FT_COMBO_55_12]|nr:MAG: cytochrome C [Nitrospirae bacterium RBG_19FT_COMBO_55_12]
MKFVKTARFALLALPLLLCMSYAKADAAEAKKAKTIDELAAMYDVTACKQCHEDIYKDWEKSIHSRSIFGTGRTAATIKTTVAVGLTGWKHSGVKKPEDVTVKNLMICAKCHLPQLADATDDVAKEIVKNAYIYADPKTSDSDRDKATAKLKKVNINCLICHNRNAIVHKWADGFPEKNAVYGSKEGSHAGAKHPVMKKSPIMNESILCGQCHGLGPNFELENPSQCATLYGSYLWAYQAEGGQETCQECHMKKSKLGHNMQSYRDPGMAKAAVDFKVEMLPHQWRDGSKMVPETLVKVELLNKSGHAIPDG